MTPEEESGVPGEKQIDDLLMQMEKCKSSICFSSVLPESSFRRHRNKKWAKLEEVLNKVGWDYYIGEYKEGKRHEHGLFAYIAIIYNIKLRKEIDEIWNKQMKWTDKEINIKMLLN